MAFRINRGIFQFKDGKDFINKFKIDTSGEMVEVDANGDPIDAYLKSGDKAADANKLDGIDSSAFLRSNANDTKSGDTTFTGKVTFETNVVLKEEAPTISFLDDTSGADDFYIHINSNNFYILRDTAGANTVDGDWDSPHPMQLEGDTNRVYFFGNLVGSAAYAATSDFDAAGTGAAAASDVADALTPSIEAAQSAAEAAQADATKALTAIPTNNKDLTNGAGYLTSSNDRVYITDSRGAARAPSYYNDRYAQWDFQNKSDTGAGGDAWHALLTVSKWSVYDATHKQEQLIFTGNDLKRRTASSDSAWGSIKTIWDSGNLDAFVGATVSNDTITFTKANGGTVAVTTTDANTNTWRPVDDTPVDGRTTHSISSNWAFDNVKTAVPANAKFTDTNTQLTDAQVRSKFSAGTNVAISNTGVISATDTNTWRPLGTGADQAAAGNHTHDYLPLGGGTITGGITVSGSLSRGTYTTASQYHTGADNIVLKGNGSGISSIFFESEKNGTNINHASDFGFIQYHPYGTSTSGESNELVIGVSNDADDHLVFNAPNANGLKFRVGASETDYTVWHSGNFNPADKLGATAKAADSEKLDGINSSQFLRSDTSDSMSGSLQVSATVQGATVKATSTVEVNGASITYADGVMRFSL